MFLGENLIPWLMLAFGAAMLVGNVAALVRPPKDTKKGDLAEAPRGRSLLMVVIGLIVTIWAVASFK